MKSPDMALFSDFDFGLQINMEGSLLYSYGPDNFFISKNIPQSISYVR